MLKKNYTIRMGTCFGLINIVKLLLQDERVVP